MKILLNLKVFIFGHRGLDAESSKNIIYSKEISIFDDFVWSNNDLYPYF